MSRFQVHNKLKDRIHFDVGIIPEFDQWPDSGIIPAPATVDPRFGVEMTLLVFDKTPFIHEIAKTNPFQLRLKTGVTNTEFGPVGFLLFYVPDPNRPMQPVILMDYHIDPKNSQKLAPWRQLASQSHWHLVLIDSGPKVVDLLEFENVFGLDSALNEMVTMCRPFPMKDFAQAKNKFSEMHSAMDLFEQ
jgi:hypothetical protein